MKYSIGWIAVLLFVIPRVSSQITPGEYELSNNIISESGSSATGFCSSLADSGRVCNAPLTSVLFDGIPTLTGLDGDMWARQLLTINTSVFSASITFNFTVTRHNNGITTYTGVETIEVVLFNCPTRGIGASSIAILAGGSVIDTIPMNDNSTSCDYLVRVCVDATLSTTSQIITLNFVSVLQRLYVAEILFYSDMNRQCSPVGPITTSVITTTTSVIPTTQSGIVQLIPTGPLYIAINTRENIKCSVTGGTFIVWTVIFMNSRPQLTNDIPGINIIVSTINSSSLVVNTTDTSIIGLICICLDAGSLEQITARISLTIYGPPAPPQNVSIQVYGNTTTVSWSYQRIKTVSLSFNLSLIFFEPSKLQNLTTEVTDLQSHTFTVDGVRSCDNLIFCITGRNIAGQGNDSCIYESFPYIPPEDMIKYSLISTSESFSLNVTVSMTALCQLNNNDSVYVLEIVGGPKIIQRSDPVNSTFHFKIDDLPGRTFYKFRIISNNSIGEGSSALIQFCTNDVQGVNICSTIQGGEYNIFCKYVRGCDHSGCGYLLTGSDGVVTHGIIIGDEYHTQKIMDYNRITVYDVDNKLVQNESFDISRNVTSCIPTTEPIATSDATDNPTSSARLSAGEIAMIIIIPILVMFAVIAIIIIIIVCLCRGYFSSRSKSKGSHGGSQKESRASLELNTI